MTNRIIAPLILSLAFVVGCDGESVSDAGPMDPDADGGTVDAGPTTPDDAGAGSVCPDAPVPLDGDLVVTTEGPVRGSVVDGVAAFLGVPFAAPPVGDLRLRPPEAAECHAEERAATGFSSRCVQMNEDAVVGEEDCLYLNVWAPAAPRADRPVLVFIHGGGNTSGSASEERLGVRLYDGEELARAQDAVVVTLQYRLGALGYLVHDALSEESAQSVSGNYGILDQIAGLRWLQENLSAFGGDPSRVLVFGESAGARDTCVLLASPLASGLFSRALMQSGACLEPTLAERLDQGRGHVDELACAGPEAASCLRGLDAEAFARLGGESTSGGLVTTPFGATVDGYVLPDRPLDMLMRGEHNHVPFVIGANEHETSNLGVPPMLEEAEYRAFVYGALGRETGDEALALYPSAAFASPRDAYIAVTTDSQFVCPTRRIASAVAGSQSEPVFRYYFTRSMGARVGAFHGAELLFIFRTVDDIAALTGPRPPGDEELTDAIGGYWARFAADGDPGGEGEGAWPVYDSSTDPYLELNHPPVRDAGLLTARCDFWDGVSMSRD